MPTAASNECRHSDYKLCFKLKQHTPIIHFQADQKGATLRATELKPKLDRFLKKYAFNDSFEEYKDYLIAGQEKAFDYKVKIEQDLSTVDYEEKTLYFGNQGDGDKKYAKRASEPFTIKFFSFHSELKNKIMENFEAFLANTNFGTRQSKGYGSFYMHDVSFNPSLIKYNSYHFSISWDWETDVKIFYQFLRQGINVPTNDVNQSRKTIECNGEVKHTKFYCKPAIFLYAKERQWTWEKKVIKKKFFGDDLETQKGCREESDALSYESEQEYLLRDLFGLSSSAEWQSYNNARVNKEHSDIKRFKSPITFKPIKLEQGYMIYFWADDSVDAMLGKTFAVSCRNNNFPLSTPPRNPKEESEKFSFEDFFGKTFVKSISDYVEQPFRDDKIDEYKTLNRILGELRRQVGGVL